MSERHPLLRGHMPDSVITWRGGSPIRASRFAAAAAALADRLPARRHVVNLCQDRYAFMLGFAASLATGQTTLLPPSSAPGAILESCRDFAGDVYCLADHDEFPGDIDGIRISAIPEDACKDSELPEPDAAHLAAILFTSGSTGKPVAHGKTWGSLVAGARALGTRLGPVGGSTVIGTIPAQHMFGLETTIMLPWQNGMSVYPKRPLLPADLDVAAVSAQAPCWLMTSPIHLRACIADGLSVRGLVGAISSTMPLGPALARAAEGLWQIPVLEIYGSTEAGMIAIRRPARDERWQLCPGVRLRTQGRKLWVEGGHIATPQQITDQLAQQDDRHFTLHGRASDIIKIAGKRTTLAALNAALNRIEGVQDGVFFVPEGRARARLAAFVVAPNRSVVEIRAALRQHIDHAFLPRPLRLVSSLPREATGKMPRQALLDLAATLRDPEVTEDEAV